MGQFQGTTPLKFHLQIREKKMMKKKGMKAKRMAEKSTEAIEALQTEACEVWIYSGTSTPWSSMMG